jgi:ribosome-associated toxin RatA of RatAB toxin-antitoxin module
MRWIVYAVGAVVLIGLIVTVVGALLPRTHSASRTARLNLPPDALYALLTNVAQYQSWRPDVKSLQRLPDKAGMPAWIEDANGMKIPMRFERMQPPTLLVARIDSDDLPFGGTWTYRIVAAGATASDVTITEDGEVKNPIFRFMSTVVFGHYATIDAFLKNLRAKAG